jgi:hypothetical protein
MRGGRLRTLMSVVVAVLFPSYRAVMNDLRVVFLAPRDSRWDGEDLGSGG